MEIISNGEIILDSHRAWIRMLILNTLANIELNIKITGHDIGIVVVYSDGEALWMITGRIIKIIITFDDEVEIMHEIL